MKTQPKNATEEDLNKTGPKGRSQKSGRGKEDRQPERNNNNNNNRTIGRDFDNPTKISGEAVLFMCLLLYESRSGVVNKIHTPQQCDFTVTRVSQQWALECPGTVGENVNHNGTIKVRVCDWTISGILSEI